MIRFSKSEDYSFILIHSLAKEHKKRLVPLSEVAKKHTISLLFLRNLANKLRKAEIVGAVEGKKGGYFLQKDPSEIKVGEILAIFSPHPILPCCSIGNKQGNCDKEAFCDPGRIWRKLNQDFLEKISAMSLLEFVSVQGDQKS